MEDIPFPIEFIVQGTPVSLQAKRAASRAAWMERVKAASTGALPEYHMASSNRMSVTLFFLPPEEMQGDIDNIVKPILDAMCRHVFIDDKQVERVVVQKFEPGRVFSFTDPSETFAKALAGAKPALYVKVSNNPHEDLRS